MKIEYRKISFLPRLILATNINKGFYSVHIWEWQMIVFVCLKKWTTRSIQSDTNNSIMETWRLVSTTFWDYLESWDLVSHFQVCTVNGSKVTRILLPAPFSKPFQQAYICKPYCRSCWILFPFYIINWDMSESEKGQKKPKSALVSDVTALASGTNEAWPLSAMQFLLST